MEANSGTIAEPRIHCAAAEAGRGPQGDGSRLGELVGNEFVIAEHGSGPMSLRGRTSIAPARRCQDRAREHDSAAAVLIETLTELGADGAGDRATSYRPRITRRRVVVVQGNGTIANRRELRC